MAWWCFLGCYAEIDNVNRSVTPYAIYEHDQWRQGSAISGYSGWTNVELQIINGQ
ncbi:hypothetical protein SUSAZ_08850 [Sulfolobus acidocaldarius SUSAZ]|nr:hypothetical protein SUSAZ_08850 [Sulfolobus acidocaldarius SUSAZ]